MYCLEKITLTERGSQLAWFLFIHADGMFIEVEKKPLPKQGLSIQVV